jgi:membrane-bound lytic murein transglycosylase D
MRGSAKVWAVLLAGTCFLASCDDSAKKTVQVRPPAATPAPVPDYVRQPLPLPQHPVSFALLAPEVRPEVDVLVAKVQATYDAGQNEVKAGHLDKAQADFDAAADLILKSGFPEDFDPRLSKLSDQIGEAVEPGNQSPAMAGGEDQENAEESETPAEPAPIDELADLTLPAGDPRLALKAEKELIGVRHDLPLTVNDSVLQYMSYFTTTRGRAIVSRGLDRAGRYDDMIRRVLKEEGVPQDLIYLAQAESAFQPQAVSRAGARGIWQFMPYRGEEYDLERTYWVDDRSDPEKSTRAAARHLRDLYGIFGDWYLVMAAYNSGPLNVARAIQRTGYADFWELQKRKALPKQTQNYVPIILALALVAKDPAGYGVQVTPEKPAPFETVSLEHSIGLQLVADATSVDLDDLRLLNPQLLRNTTPNGPGFQLKLPSGSTKNFEENIQQVPEDKWTSWRLHAAGEGETLPDIARHYRVTVASIETANHLQPHANVPSGFLLNVPTPPPTVRLVSYRVKRGDTLDGIAGRFDVTVEQLKHWNHISGEHVSRGTRLRIYAGSQSANVPPAKAKSARNENQTLRNVSARQSEKPEALEHRVKPGETLYSIAHEYQTSVTALKQANAFLADRPLEAGDLLSIQR